MAIQFRYFVNDKDRIRKISDPNAHFQYKINRNPRWNEAQMEAMSGMHTASRYLKLDAN